MMKALIVLIKSVALIAAIAFFYGVFFLQQDGHPDSHLDLSIKAQAEPSAPFQAGFAAIDITPEVADRWYDVNSNAKYEPEDGDSYDDLNGNGVFDAVWIAGFSHQRAANGVHDAIWARTAIFDDGQARVAIVSLDVVGLLHEDVLDIRQALPASLGVDYLLLVSTHTHEGPDTMGLWGESILSSGVDDDYLRHLKAQVVKSVATAVQAMRPATLHVSQDLRSAEPLVEDSRRPYVLDAGLRTIRAIDSDTQLTLGTLVVWANHPETLWSGNLLISSDFPHYVRETVELGLHNETTDINGVGGVAVYINGAIGGLMTTSPRHGIHALQGDELLYEPTFAKAEALGGRLGLLALQSMQQATELTDTGISIRAKSIYLPVDNVTFLFAAMSGLLQKDFSAFNETRSEVAAINIGPISIAAIPGEIYPELVNGGIEAPPGQDFNTPPVEVPPIRDMMGGEFKFIFGLANDQLGYIIPLSEWDEKAPFLYNADKSPYGESNSLGKDTAIIIHRELQQLLNDNSAD